MGTFLCSVVALATLVQAPSDSLAALRERVARDSLDGAGWLLVGRGYLQEAEEAHGRAHRAEGDSAWARAALDTAEAALARAVALAGPAGPSAAGDSARVLRVGVWAARSRLTWEEGGIAAALDAWGPLPTDLRVPAVLEELGENLLRACPPGGVLLTAGEADSDAAWYMRFARGLRPDLLVLPLAAWRSDAPLRARLARDLKLARRSANDGWLAELARRRPVCVSMAFERPPDVRPRVGWAPRSLVWVAGPQGKGPAVPARDFGFAALRVGLDAHDPWADPALAVYTRAARATRALCEPLATFKVSAEVATCRK
ncbi:MAG TPA: hypothetical protein VN964_16575 [Gemmatimonadales bacterium]|nr:hypothetical protein [Gemmatimonadales bacterium]